MISRRQFNSLAIGTLLSAGLSPRSAFSASGYEPVLGENGHYTQPWFLESFMEVADDLAEARDQGKRFAIMWELEGCPYCRETHFVNFGIPEIRNYVEENFLIVQLDLKGSREVTGFDGATTSEKAFARANGVRFTPTVQFFPETLEGLSAEQLVKPEIARMPGYFKPFHFLTMFQYVKEKSYEKQDFRTYLKSKIASYKDAGKQIPDWNS
jgi:thioredoxin-related protein